MVHSTVEPGVIDIDRIRSGKAEILVHWDISQVETEEGEIVWQYEECRMQWVLPGVYSAQGILDYFRNNEAEIVSWAQATKVQFKKEELC